MAFCSRLAQLGETGQTAEEPSTQQENIEALITAGTEEGIIEEEDRRLIQSVVAFGNKTVREVMTPRPAMVAISADATLEDLRQLVIHEQFSRIPVYEESIDQIIGFIHVRDMFELDHTERLASQRARTGPPDPVRPGNEAGERSAPRDAAGRQPHRRSWSMSTATRRAWSRWRTWWKRSSARFATSTSPVSMWRSISEGGYIVSGSFDVDHLHDLVEFRKPEDTESTTVGGLVTEWMGRVPEAGETIERDGVRIEVLGCQRTARRSGTNFESGAGKQQWRIRKSGSSPALFRSSAGRTPASRRC